MKILVMSDSHRNVPGLEEILRANADADEIVFLGDGIADMEKCMKRIPTLAQKNVRIVCGNCDGFSDRPEEIIFEVCGHKILCTHGYLQNVKRGLDRIAAEAMEKGCDIALYGHTHRADYSDDYPGVKLFNPGAVMGYYYGVITIDEQSGETEFALK